MQARIKMAAPGRKSRVVRVTGNGRVDFAKQAAGHIRELAQQYGVSPIAVEYDVLVD